MHLSEEPKLIYACLQVDALVSPFILRMLFFGFSGMPPYSTLWPPPDAFLSPFIYVVTTSPLPQLKGCLYNLPNNTIYLDFLLIIITECSKLSP